MNQIDSVVCISLGHWSMEFGCFLLFVFGSIYNKKGSAILPPPSIPPARGGKQNSSPSTGEAGWG